MKVEHKGYVGLIELDAGVYFGRVQLPRDVVTFQGPTVEHARAAFVKSVEDYLAFCASRGESPELPEMEEG